MNPDSRKIITAFVEPMLANAKPEDRFQFERNGYFVADSKDHAAGRPVFNRAVTLRDSWGQRA
jgi:glutaminyl-tRNA synthetase